MKKIVPGFWYHHRNNCKKYNIKSTKLFKIENLKKRNKIITGAYNIFLQNLKKNLNKIHNINWNEKSWEIIIGPWLMKYLTIILDRFSTIQDNKSNDESFYFTSKKKRSHLNTYNINEFSVALNNDEWNEELFWRIDNYLKNKDLEKLLYRKKILFLNNKKQKTWFTVKNFLINCLTKAYVKIFCKKSKIVLSRLFFGNKFRVLEFIFRLREFPIIYNLNNSIINTSFDAPLRNKLLLTLEKNEFYKISSFLLKETFPRIYLEGFKEVIKRIEKTSLPNKKTIIFTSNIFNDSIFKFWVAKQKNLGSKIIIAQHGGGYNYFDYHLHGNYELSICDRYLSWGWTNEKYKNKIIKFGVLDNKIFPEKNSNKKDLSLVMCNFQNYIINGDYFEYLSLFRSEKTKNYIELNVIENFFDKFKKKINKNIVLRPHPLKTKEFSTIRFEKKFKKIFKINRDYKTHVTDFLRNFSLNIVPFHSTPFSFSMAKNFPTLTIYPFDLKYLKPDLRKIFIKMNKSGICHFNHSSLLNFFKKNQNKIDVWWNNKKTQEARKSFCIMHANTIKNRVEQLSNILNLEKKKI